MPPGAINWNDADDNNAFHAKQIVMDLDGTISTEVAIFNKKQDYNDIVTMGLPLSNDGKPVPSQAGSLCGLIPKGAKNVEVAKEFLKYLIQPKVINEWLKTGLGRNTAVHAGDREGRPLVARPDPHRAAYVQQGAARPDRADLLDVQPGLRPGPERACLADRLGRHHQWRDDAAGGGGEGVQAGQEIFANTRLPSLTERDTQSRKIDGPASAVAPMR